MSAKYFCDMCEDEITKTNQVCDDPRLNRLRHRLAPNNRLGVEVVTALDGVINAGVFCKYCVIDAVNQADDRVQAKPIEVSAIDVVFDGPCGPEGPRFIEAEDSTGASVRVGQWVDRGDGTWALRLDVVRT